MPSLIIGFDASVLQSSADYTTSIRSKHRLSEPLQKSCSIAWPYLLSLSPCKHNHLSRRLFTHPLLQPHRCSATLHSSPSSPPYLSKSSRIHFPNLVGISRRTVPHVKRGDTQISYVPLGEKIAPMKQNSSAIIQVG